MPVIEIETDLKAGQISRFRKLLEEKKIINGRVYFPTSQMHGVLMTNSKQGALNIVKANLKTVQPYLHNIDDDQYIKHIGIDILLDDLGHKSPKKKIQYLAAKAYIAAYLANDSEVFKDAALCGKVIEQEKTQAMQGVKRKATHCALTGKPFGNGVECYIHHVEGVSERPDLATDPNNLLPLCKEVHNEYHSWAKSQGREVSRASLKHFAVQNNYNRNWP